MRYPGNASPPSVGRWRRARTPAEMLGLKRVAMAARRSESRRTWLSAYAQRAGPASAPERRAFKAAERPLRKREAPCAVLPCGAGERRRVEDPGK